MKSKLGKILLALAMVFSMLINSSSSGTKVYGDEADYLTFTAQEDNATISFSWKSGSNVMYNLNGTGWQDYSANTAVTLSAAGEYVQFKADNIVTNVNQHFVMSGGKIAASGDVTSLTNSFGGDTALSEFSCQEMFEGCANLVSAPDLPSTSLANYCYMGMFCDCTSLTKAPALPATNLNYGCYESMFKNCSSLVSAPVLSATKVVSNCYEEMFFNCTSLTKAPALPATEIDSYCYYMMFYGCSSLLLAPSLPAKNLAEGCYRSMFYECTSLSTMPTLSATYLPAYCYEFMFAGCTNLEIYDTSTKGAKSWSLPLDARCGQDATHAMLYSTGGNFQGNPVPGTTYYYLANKANYLTFTALENNASMSFTWNGGSNVMYNLNGTGWQDYSQGTSITLKNTGDYVQFKGIFVKTWIEQHFYISSGKIAASGDVTSLVNGVGGDTYLSDYNFAYMFFGCTDLITAPELPSTCLSNCCYYEMFYRCYGLQEAPDLPATSLTNHCYYCMFYECTNLTKAADIEATSVDVLSCGYMYTRCVNLTEVQDVLPATQLAEYCYEDMFADCTSLTKAPALPATKMYHGCYAVMFSGCTSLTDLPELPATVLAEWCYGSMFSGCTNIKLSSEQTGLYQKQWSIPENAKNAKNVFSFMFNETGGTFTGEPEIGVTYYISTPHQIVYSINENEIIAKCEASSHANCQLANGLSLTVDIHSRNYSDSTQNVTVGNDEQKTAWDEAGLETVQVAYYQNGNQIDSPEEIGDYSVKITIGDVSQEYNFSITGDKVHEWSYSLEEDAITASCIKTNSDHENGNCQYLNGISLTVIDPTCLYTGNAVEFVIGSTEEQTAWINAGLALPTVEYDQDETKIDGIPIDIGEYIAKVTVGDQTKDYHFSVDADDIHEWAYSLEDNAIKAACVKTTLAHHYGECEYADGIVLTITDPTCYYTGEAVEFSLGTIQQQVAWLNAGLTLPTVAYYNDSGEVEGLPTEIGTYIAIVTIDDQSKDYMFSIDADDIHEWSYAINEDAVAAKCIKLDLAHYYGECEYEQAISLTITDPTCLYTGNPVEFIVGTSEEQQGWINAGLTLPTVEYYQGKTRLDQAPSAIGVYSAKVTMGNVSQEYEFSINADEVHEWAYEIGEDVVTANCIKIDPAHQYGKCEYAEGISLTIIDPSCTYTGNAVEFCVGTAEEQQAWQAAGLDLPAVEYYNDDGQLEEAPVNAGNYTAVVTIGEEMNSYDFTISKAVYTGKTSYTLNIYTLYTGTIALDILPEGWNYDMPEYDSVIKSASLTENTLTCKLKSLSQSVTGNVVIPVIGDANHEDSYVNVSVSKQTAVSLSKCKLAVTQSTAEKLDITVTDPNGNIVDPSCYKVTTIGTIKKGRTVIVRVTGITSTGYSSSKSTRFKVVM